MRARLSTTTALLPLFALALTPFLSSEPAPSAPPTTSVANKYIGAAKCKNCHNSEESGDQYGAWQKAKHSHAFEVLQSPEAKEVAAKLGLGDPSKEDGCVKCHVTGFGEPEDAFGRGWKQELGVQCETCHSQGDAHMKARFQAAMKGKPKDYEPTPEGEIVVTPDASLCLKCHNPESPSYVPFCYYEARAQIAHFDPRRPRTDEEKAAYGKCPCGGDPCEHKSAGCPEGKCNLKPDELAALKKE